MRMLMQLEKPENFHLGSFSHASQDFGEWVLVPWLIFSVFW